MAPFSCAACAVALEKPELRPHLQSAAHLPRASLLFLYRCALCDFAAPKSEEALAHCLATGHPAAQLRFEVQEDFWAQLRAEMGRLQGPTGHDQRLSDASRTERREPRQSLAAEETTKRRDDTRSLEAETQTEAGREPESSEGRSLSDDFATPWEPVGKRRKPMEKPKEPEGGLTELLEPAELSIASDLSMDSQSSQVDPSRAMPFDGDSTMASEAPPGDCYSLLSASTVEEPPTTLASRLPALFDAGMRREAELPVLAQLTAADPAWMREWSLEELGKKVASFSPDDASPAEWAAVRAHLGRFVREKSLPLAEELLQRLQRKAGKTLLGPKAVWYLYWCGLRGGLAGLLLGAIRGGRGIVGPSFGRDGHYPDFERTRAQSVMQSDVWVYLQKKGDPFTRLIVEFGKAWLEMAPGFHSVSGRDSAVHLGAALSFVKAELEKEAKDPSHKTDYLGLGRRVEAAAARHSAPLPGATGPQPLLAWDSASSVLHVSVGHSAARQCQHRPGGSGRPCLKRTRYQCRGCLTKRGRPLPLCQRTCHRAHHEERLEEETRKAHGYVAQASEALGQVGVSHRRLDLTRAFGLAFALEHWPTVGGRKALCAYRAPGAERPCGRSAKSFCRACLTKKGNPTPYCTGRGDGKKSSHYWRVHEAALEEMERLAV